MKKIISKEDLEKKKSRSKMIGGVILIALLLFSSLGYAFYSSSGSQSSYDDNQDNGIEQGSFVNGRWYYLVSGNDHLFQTYLELARKSEVNLDKSVNDFSGALYVDADETSFAEIKGNLGYYIGNIRRACYGGCDEDYPEKTCSDNLIVVSESENERVYEEENCIFIEGSMNSVDAFLYKILGLY